MARRTYARRPARSSGSYRRGVTRKRSGPARSAARRSGGGSRAQTVRIVLQTTAAPVLGGYPGAPGAASSVRDDKAKF